MKLLREYLDIAKNPVLLLSGGRDSVFLLSEIRKLRANIDCICFATDFTREQWKIIENLIKLWSLEVYTFQPQHTFLVPNGRQLARVDEFSLGGVCFPVVRDVIHDDNRCLLDMDTKRSAGLAPWNYDVCFVGSRKSDYSETTGQPFRREVISTNGITFVAPLWNYSDAEIAKADLPISREFYELGDEKFDTGNIVSCSRCFDTGAEQVFCPKVGHDISTVDWNPAAMLGAFQEKFRINKELDYVQ